MNSRLATRATAALLILLVGLFSLDYAEGCCSQIAATDQIGPTNTVILANESDAAFSQDFSVLLKHSRLEWVTIDDDTVPESVWDKNIILLATPYSPHTSQVMRGLLRAEEFNTIRIAEAGAVVLEKDSPWLEGRKIFVCTGSVGLQMRDSAENVLRALIDDAPPAANWIRTTFDANLAPELGAYVESLRYDWNDSELPLADLAMDMRVDPRSRVSSQQAAEDVERLYYLFSHGYSGYAFFNQTRQFDAAKARILEELATHSSWSADDFSDLLYRQLSFVYDCHLKIGDHQYADHVDYWYDTSLALMRGPEGFRFLADGKSYTVTSINGIDPSVYLHPSLDEKGQPVYRLGLLSPEEPTPLLLVAVAEAGEREFNIRLQRSEFDYYSTDIFREDNLGGIPVLRVRSFGDSEAAALERFVKSASRFIDEPVVIVDVRGNGGGNEAWPINWIRRLTGRRPESVFIFSELRSKTSLVSRANLFTYWYDLHPDTLASYKTFAEQAIDTAKAIESGAQHPGWVGPNYPDTPLIPNDTTIVVVMNGQVASAGEGFVMRVSQAENVILVGENSRGCLTFGNAGMHLLPNSRLRIQMPINFGIFTDMVFREGTGLEPDLWVPAAEAVNYAVAALRAGTITTNRPLPPDTLQMPFVPEDPWARVREERIRLSLAIAGLSIAGTVWFYFVRARPRIVMGVGAGWLVAGSVIISQGKYIGLGLILLGVIGLSWGGLNRRKERSEPDVMAG